MGDRVVSDMSEDMAQVGMRINAVELGADDQRVHGRGTIAATVGAEEHVVFASQCNTAQRILGQVVVDLGAAVIAVINQGLPLIEQVLSTYGSRQNFVK